MDKLVVIASRVPFPIDKGDKLRIFHQVKELSKHFEVCLCVLSEDKVSQKSIDELHKIASKVEIIQLNKFLIYWNLFKGLFSKKPFQVLYFYQSSAQKKVSKLIQDTKPIHIYCQLIRCAEYVKNIHHIPKTIDYMDTFSKGIERRIDTSGWKKILFKKEYARLIKYENLIFDYFDFHTIISEQDRQYIFHPNKNEIAIVPNGIDFHYFHPIQVEKKYDLVFVGNMSYPPNVDAMLYLVNDIIPKVKIKIPTVTLLIAGASPAKEIVALQNDAITVSGWVDDIRQCYAVSKIFVAPMRIGTGLQNKLLEAMAMGIPSVTSVLANKALKADPGQEIIACKTTDDFVDQITTLLTNTTIQQELSNNGQTFIKQHFNWEANVSPYVDFFKKAKNRGS